MKSTKRLVIVCMVLLIGVFATIPQTFSWFDRAAGQTGGVLEYSRDDLPVSNGGVTVKTDDYVMTGNEITLDPLTKAKVETSGNTTKSVGKGVLQYYKTTINNNNNTDAYVDLYMNGATNSSKFYVGVINPVITEKQVGAPTRTAVDKSDIRIYFQLRHADDGDNKWYTSGGTNAVYLYAKVGNTTESVTVYRKINSYDDKYTDAANDKIDTYYADLPDKTSEFYISKQSTAGATGFKRTRTITSFTPGTLYYLTGRTTDDDNNYAEMLTYRMSDGLSVPKSYTDVYTSARRSVYLKLPAGTNANSVTYSVNKTSDIIEINENTGRAKVKTSEANGAVVTTTVSGPLLASDNTRDTRTIKTKIHVPGTVDNFPICRNIHVPAGQTKIVEWFIKNDFLASYVPQDNSIVTTLGYSSIYYTI